MAYHEDGNGLGIWVQRDFDEASSKDQLLRALIITINSVPGRMASAPSVIVQAREGWTPESIVEGGLLDDITDAHYYPQSHALLLNVMDCAPADQE